MTKKKIQLAEQECNEMLRNIKMKASQRYNYWAIDITSPSGDVISTLAVGLTKQHIYDMLCSIRTVIVFEQSI